MGYKTLNDLGINEVKEIAWAYTQMHATPEMTPIQWALMYQETCEELKSVYDEKTYKPVR